MKISALNEVEEKILRENHLNPKEYGLIRRTADSLKLLCFDTRDIVTIDKGDRKW